MPRLSALRKRLERNKTRLVALSVSLSPKQANEFAKYHDDPSGFAREVLGFTFTPKQEEMAAGLLKPPYRVLALSANEQGKTSGAAAVVLWWHVTRVPSIIITTAPKFDQVKKLLWKEIRRLARQKLNLSFQPKACHIERSPDDFAVGVTARDATSFQGHHGPNQLFVFDEATGIAAEFWEAVESMFSPPGHAWLAIFNPTTTESQVFIEYSATESARRKDRGVPWHLVRMSALDHPNIDAELRGEDPPVPHAMRLGKFERLLYQWSTMTGADPNKPVGSEGGPGTSDIVWPPLWATDYCQRTGQTPRVYRPGPEAQARLLARFPDQSASGIWGDGDWLSACRELDGQKPLEEPGGFGMPLPELGCDVARFGDDLTEMHARCGSVSILHQNYAKQAIDSTAGQLIVLAKWLADWHNRRKEHLQPAVTWQQIPIKVDDSGVGGGVTDILKGEGAAVVPINAQEKANEGDKYPNKRSELWFVTAEMARRGDLDFSRLDSDVRDELRRQAMSATWKLDKEGRRVVEEKAKIKERIKRSPDSIDAVNLAYAVVGIRGVSGTAVAARQSPTGGFRR